MGGEVVLSKPLKLSSAFRKEEEKHGIRITCSSSCLNARDHKLVCVTSANSFLASYIVKQLLSRGYLVRLTIENPVDFEEIKRVMKDEEMDKLENVVVAKMKDLEGLCNAFRGCHAVFHTSSFIDPHGLSGYSEQMGFLEMEAAKNVIEACGRAAYVRRCVFTSSLLASIWVNDDDLDKQLIDENCWSNEDFCRHNKLWLALGKMRAEKEAWRKSKELKVNLVTLCPALLMPTSLSHLHTQPHLPYLKGGSIMLRRGTLAIADVKKVAEAHVRVYEAMDDGAHGRYICFDKVVRTMEDAFQLQNDLKIHGILLSYRGMNDGFSEEEGEEIPNRLCNSRLSKLLSQASQGVSCNQH